MSLVQDKYFDHINENKHVSEENVDPRVQVELERLNNATDLINKLEIELDDARANFRLLLTESSHRISFLAKKLGTCIEKSRPYYEARMKAKELQAETQKAALRFERASSAHTAAKEMVMLAEEGLAKEGRTFDPAWQEMLNHATMRVNEAESERILSEIEHQHTSQSYNEAERRVSELHQELKRSIGKSRSYFEMKAQFNELLEEQKRRVHQLEEKVLKVKMSYAETLRNLELISDEIHERRKRQECFLSETRSEGVGAESPVPPQMSDKSEPSPHVFSPFQYPEVKTSVLSTVTSGGRESVTASTPLSAFPVVPCSDSLPKMCDDSYSISKPGPLTPGCHVALVPNEMEQPNSQTHNDGMLTNDVKKTHSVHNGESSTSNNRTINTSKDCGILVSQFGNMKLLAAENNTDTEENKDLHESSQCKIFLNGVKSNPPQLLESNVQEEFSDTESLTSTGTTETLDDHQIECLLLDRILQSDFQEMVKTEN